MNPQQFYLNLLAWIKIAGIFIVFGFIGIWVYYLVFSPKMIFDAFSYVLVFILVSKLTLTYSIRDYNRRRIELESLEFCGEFLEFLCRQNVVSGISESDKEMILEMYYKYRRGL
jgi:hypothetical protein